MKIRELPTDTAFDVMVKILPHVSEIVNDPQMAKCRAVIDEKKKEIKLGDLVGISIPMLAKDHKEAFISIVAAANGMDVNEVKSLPISETIQIFEDTIGFVSDFFMLSLRTAVKA